MDKNEQSKTRNKFTGSAKQKPELHGRDLSEFDYRGGPF